MTFYTAQPALDRLVEARDKVHQTDGPVILVTVVEAIGSNPQAVGARMLLFRDGEMNGTVGGGKIESLVLKDAQKLFEGNLSFQLLSYNLQEIGMTCGGKMTFFFERIDPAPRLFLFGAGHIAVPTAALAATTGFRVTVIDEREEWATEERFPNAELIRLPFPMFLETFVAQPNHYLVMVSQGHAHDAKILKRVIGGVQRYTGVIGSKQKAHKLRKELLAENITEEQWMTVQCPMGIPIGGDTAEEIAVSIVGQLIKIRHQS